ESTPRPLRPIGATWSGIRMDQPSLWSKNNSTSGGSSALSRRSSHVAYTLDSHSRFVDRFTGSHTGAGTKDQHRHRLPRPAPGNAAASVAARSDAEGVGRAVRLGEVGTVDWPQ